MGRGLYKLRGSTQFPRGRGDEAYTRRFQLVSISKRSTKRSYSKGLQSTAFIPREKEDLIA